jgi:hypothetical protein
MTRPFRAVRDLTSHAGPQVQTDFVRCVVQDGRQRAKLGYRHRFAH